MAIRVLFSQKHNTARKIYNKQAGAPAPASPYHLTILLGNQSLVGSLFGRVC